MSWRRPFAVALATVLLVLGIVAVRALRSVPDAQRFGGVDRQEAAVTAGSSAADQRSDLDRTVAEAMPTNTETGGAFRSESFDGPVPDAVADGITFVVRDPSGAPVVGAPIRVGWYRPDREEHTQGIDFGETDRDGRFRSSVHTVAELDGVHVTLPWLGEADAIHELQLASQRPDTVELVAPAPAELDVLVVGAEQQPLANARVFVAHEATLDAPWRYPLECRDVVAVTGSDGRVRMRVPAGICGVTVAAAGHDHDCLWRCEFAPGSNSLLLDPAPEVARPTVVVEVVGPPPDDAAVRIDCETNVALPRAAQRAVRQVEGLNRRLFVRNAGVSKFEVLAPPVAWLLRVELAGCEPWRRWIAAEERSVHVLLTPVAPIPQVELRGTVFDVAGAPCADAELYWHTARDPDGSRLANSDAAGTFLLRRPVEIPGWLSAWRGDAAAAWAGPWSAPGAVELQLRLQPPATIEATLVDAQGRDVAASIRLVPRFAPGPAPERRGIWAGEWTKFDRLPPGDYEVWGFPDVGGWPARQLVRAGARVPLRCGEGLEGLVRIAATVVDAATQRPIPDAKIGDRATDAAGWLGLAMAPGAGEVLVGAEGYAARWFALSDFGVGRHERTFELPRAATRFLRLVGAGGRPMPDAEVTVVGPAEEPAERWLAEADGDADGRCELRGAPVGRLRLLVRRYERENGLLVDVGEARTFELDEATGLRTTAELRWQDGVPHSSAK